MIDIMSIRSCTEKETQFNSVNIKIVMLCRELNAWNNFYEKPLSVRSEERGRSDTGR